jgi:hypothetical protein
MAFDSVSDSKTKHLIVHDILGYVYFFGINQVHHPNRLAIDNLFYLLSTQMNLKQGFPA